MMSSEVGQPGKEMAEKLTLSLMADRDNKEVAGLMWKERKIGKWNGIF